MLQGEHSAILSTFIKLPFFIKTFVLSNFKWSLKTGFTVKIIILNYTLFSRGLPMQWMCCENEMCFSVDA